MEITILVENTSGKKLLNEWGLSVHADYRDNKYLIDMGGSDKFLRNAKTLGIDIGEVDAAILSHAHFDHALGMDTFFKVNNKAKLYIREGAKANCYSKYLFIHKYIGIRRGILEEFGDRIEYTSGRHIIDDGVTIVPHSTPGLEEIGKRCHLYLKCDKPQKSRKDKNASKPQDGVKFKKYIPDNFDHEQSIVFETDNGLVIISPCSHAGAGNIVREVQKSFKGQRINCIIGGFHLFGQPAGYVKEFAHQLLETGVEQVYTGHCTGERAYNILRGEMGDIVKPLETGLVITV